MPAHALIIDNSSVSKMIAHAESVPEECCGFLLGFDREARTVIEVMPSRNVSMINKEKQFEIDPLDYLKAEHYAEDNAIELVGIYHSHPNHPAIPSEHDRRAALPHFSYVILSLMNQKFDGMRSWRIDNQQRFTEEHITTPLS